MTLIVTRKSWTTREVALLRAARKQGLTLAYIASLLGRSVSSIQGGVTRYCPDKQPRTSVDDAWLARLRELNAQGWCDTDVAAELGCERHTVARHRKRLNLPSHARGDRFVARIQAANRRTWASVGARSIAEYAGHLRNERQMAAGWPSDLTPRELAVLKALAIRPMTIAELVAHLGLRMPPRSCKALGGKSRTNSTLAELARRALVCRSGREVRRPGRGRSVSLYRLGPSLAHMRVRQAMPEPVAIGVADGDEEDGL